MDRERKEFYTEGCKKLRSVILSGQFWATEKLPEETQMHISGVFSGLPPHREAETLKPALQ